MLRYILFLLLIITPVKTHAYDDDIPLELQSFDGFSLPIDEASPSSGTTPRISRQPEIIPYIQSSVSKTAAFIISNPEQVFCYQITKKTPEYKGYTINNTAITGYCGELNGDKISTVYEALFTKSQNILTQKSSCKIEPRIMLRFVRGVDYADVLLSSPCPSFTVFYGGKYTPFNIIQGIIDDIIKQMEKDISPFYSPSLLKQTVANATPNTVTEKETVEKKARETDSLISWKKKKEQPEEEKPQKPGWGGLNLKLRENK